MPLKTGRSKKVVSENIGEMVSKYKKTGEIGTSKPASKGRAVKQAAAIALSAAGKSKKPVKKAEGGEITYKRDGNNPVHLYSKGGCVKKKR